MLLGCFCKFQIMVNISENEADNNVQNVVLDLLFTDYMPD